MSQFRTIEIDFDVHKQIEQERKSFAERPNEALRRLLGLGASEAHTKQPDTTGPKVRAWSKDNVTLPHGTKLRMEYNGREHTGEIEDGKWAVEGKRFGSPSAAAAGVAITKAGKSASLDGWHYWKVMRPGDQDWMLLGSLRGRPASRTMVALTDEEL